MAAAFWAAPEPNGSSVVLVLLGGRGSGKTRAGNTILGTGVLQEGWPTTHTSCRTTSILGTQVMVVDTPGWPAVQSDGLSDKVFQEICKGLALCQSQPHAFLLVLPITSSFGYEEWQAMEAHLQPFQGAVWPQAMVLFTHADQLGALSIQEYLARQPGVLHLLLERCGYRYHTLTQAEELLVNVYTMSGVNPTAMRDTRPGMPCWLRAGERRGGKEMTMWHHGGRSMEGVMEMSAGVPRALTSLKPDISLILLGRRRSGKSSAGNTILGKTEFQSGTKTVTCTVGHGTVLQWPVTVVDTPGWSLYGLTKSEQVRQQIQQSSLLCPRKGKLCFLLTIPVDLFKEKDRRAIEKNLAVLGDAVWRRTSVLFTYGRELGGRTIEEHMEEKGEPLCWVLQRCGHRHCVFDNHKGEDTQVSRLLEMAERWW